MGFNVLGALEAHGAEGRPARLSPKLRDVLAILLCAPNTAVRCDRLADGLWDGAPPRTAAVTLRGYVCHLRRALGEDRIASRPSGYAVVVRDGELDADRFAHLVEAGRAALGRGERAAGARLLREASDLWRGDPFDGQDHLPAVRREAVRLAELRLAASEERIDADLALGRHAALVGELRALVADEPFRERFRAQLMLALYRLGRSAEALAVYREGRALLAAELGLDPSPALRRLERAMLDHEPSLTGSARGGR